MSEKEIRIGNTIEIFNMLRIIKIRKETVKELNKLPKNVRNKVLDETIKITLNTTHPYNVNPRRRFRSKKVNSIKQ